MSKQHFDLNQKSHSEVKSSNDPRQLDFNDLKFHLPEVDFASSPAYDLSKLNFSKRLSYQKTSKKYFGYSFVLHAMMASAVLFLSVPLIKEEKKEPITIEIQSLSGNEASQPIPLPIKSAQAAPSAANPKEETIAAPQSVAPVMQKTVAKPAPRVATVARPVALPPPSESEDMVDEPVIKLKPIAAAKVPKMKVAPVAKATTKAAPAKAAPAKMLSEESDVAVPESIDDIQSPHLDEAAVHSASAKANTDNLNKDVENDFSKVDQQPDALLEKESQQLGALTKDLENETQENLKAIEEQNKAEQEAQQKAIAHRRQQEAQAIAAAQAQEKAEAQALQQAQAQAAADRAAAARAAAAQAAAQAAAEAAAEKAAQQQAGNGQGDGEAQQTGGSPGVGEIRSLQDMRQMPGNPKPSYDYNERLRGDAGEVVFLAYVTKDGSTTQFKLSKSTGHRNLDLKTLKALKKWKFYPGQEGWVEFPFRWDLQGGAQEMPALLRRGR